MEQVSGQDLDWFFNEWIYGPGYPNYHYSWRAYPSGNQWLVNIWVDQVQASGGPFTMPINFGVVSAVDTVVQTCWIDSDPDTISFISGTNQPIALIFDYDNWVLDQHTEIPWAVQTETPVPMRYCLNPAYPNPFNSYTAIGFELPFTCRATLTVWNVLGQKVTTLQDGQIDAGTHRLIWNGRNDLGNEVSSGMYLITLSAPGFHQTEKVVLLR